MRWCAPVVDPLEARQAERRRQWRESQQRARGKRPPLPPEYLATYRLKNLRGRSA